MRHLITSSLCFAITALCLVAMVSCSTLTGITGSGDTTGRSEQRSGQPSPSMPGASSPTGCFCDISYDTGAAFWTIPTDANPTGLSISIGGRGGWPVVIYDIQSVEYRPDRIVVIDPKKTMSGYSYTVLYK
jgi:hypothetical protein